MKNGYLDIFEKIALTNDPWSAGTSALQALGCEQITVAQAGSSDCAAPIISTNMKLGFVEDYIRQASFKTDPWLGYSVNQSKVWHLRVDDFACFDEPSGMQSLARLFSDHGYRDVVLVPSGAKGTAKAAVLYFSHTDNPTRLPNGEEWKALINATRIFSGVVTHLDSRTPYSFDLRTSLSIREKEALNWLAAGHRVDRIAAGMGVRNITVHKYFESIRNKLGTRTRDESLAKAISLGVVNI